MLFLFSVIIDLLFSCCVVVYTARVHGRAHNRVHETCEYNAVHAARVNGRARVSTRAVSMAVVDAYTCTRPVHGRVHSRVYGLYTAVVYTARTWPVRPCLRPVHSRCTRSCTRPVRTRPCTQPCTGVFTARTAPCIRSCTRLILGHGHGTSPCTGPCTRPCTRPVHEAYRIFNSHKLL